MLKIKKLNGENRKCINLLETMFTNFGIKPLNPSSPISYWAVESEDDEMSLLDNTILTQDAKENQLRAVFFITRPKNRKKLKLFRIMELFPALHLTEHAVTISEAIEAFLGEKTDHVAPIVVVCLGKLTVNDQPYEGGFLYQVPEIKGEACIEAVSPKLLRESRFPEEVED